MNSKTTILIADDHLVVRMGLATIIGLEKDLVVAGEAKDGAEAVRLAGELKPDVIVMDLMMPRLNGAEATAKILAADPSAKILILTTFSSSEGVKAALDAGAVGAIVKDSSDAELLAAMRAAASIRRSNSAAISVSIREMSSRASSSAVIGIILSCVSHYYCVFNCLSYLFSYCVGIFDRGRRLF